MIEKSALFKSVGWAAVCLLGLLLPAISQANEVDLDKPVKLHPGQGIAVFSITIHGGQQQGMYVKWRAVGDAKTYPGARRKGEISITSGALFATEEFSKTPRHVPGRLAALSLPPGAYEFYAFRTANSNGSGSTMLSTDHNFSRKFNVEEGKVQYVGSLDILEGPSYVGGGGILGGLLIGAWVGSIEVFPTMLDASDLDVPMILAKDNGLSADDVQQKIIPDESDRHIQALVDELRGKAEQGDAAAQQRLLLSLLQGWGTTESGEEFKIMEMPELQQQLAEKLAAQGINGGAYALVLQKAPGLNDFPLGDVSADVIDQQLIEQMRGDAERYFPQAMRAMSTLYHYKKPRTREDAHRESFWDDRRSEMHTLKVKSVPYLGKEGKAEFRKFKSASMPRFFALSANGAYGMSDGDDATAKAAITACEARNAAQDEHCRLYAENRGVVWDACPVEYVGPQVSVFPPETGLGSVKSLSHLPSYMGKEGKMAYREFLELRMPRAFAVAEDGEFGMASGDCHAAYKALKNCHDHSGKACQLYTIDDQIVLGATDEKLVEEEQRLAGLIEADSQDGTKLSSQTVTSDAMSAE